MAGPDVEIEVVMRAVAVSRNGTPWGVAKATMPRPASAIWATVPIVTRPTSAAVALSMTIASSADVAGAVGCAGLDSDDRAAIGSHVQELDGGASRHEGPRRDVDRLRAGPAGRIQQRRVDDPDFAAARPDEYLVTHLVDGEGLGAGHGDVDDEGAGGQVVGPDRRSGGNPEAITGDTG